MITAFVQSEGALKRQLISGIPNLTTADAMPAADLLPSHIRAVAEQVAESCPSDAVWLDLCNPSSYEIASVERAFNVEIPTREESTGRHSGNGTSRNGAGLSQDLRPQP